MNAMTVLPDFVKRLQTFDTYSEIDEILRSPDFVMATAPDREMFLGDTLILSEGQRHRELQQLFAPLFSRQTIAYYELHLVEPVIRDRLANVEADRSADGLVRIDIVPFIQSALAGISAKVTGIDGVDTPNKIENFIDLVQTVGASTTGIFSNRPQAEMIERGKAALATLVDTYLQASLDQRKELVRRHRAGEIAREDLPRDVLTTLCLADDLYRPDDTEKIPYVWRQVALFMTASIKTTSHTLPHVFIHLDQWLAEHPEDRHRLVDFDFLHRAAAESFRLHQTAPAFFRRALRDVTLRNGRKVAKDEMVAMLFAPANLSDEVFGDRAQSFDPHRAAASANRSWGLTFGLGTHSCIGQNLVTGIRNRGDQKLGTHGTAVKIMKALYDLGCDLDPDRPPRRLEGSMHDSYESVPVILRNV